MFEWLFANIWNILLVILYLFIFNVIVVVILLRNKRNMFEKDWHKHRCKPYILPISGWIYADPGQSAIKATLDNFNGCIWQRIKAYFNIFIEPLRKIMSMITDVLSDLTINFNVLRSQLSIMRRMIMGLVIQLMKKIENLMAAAVFTFSKIYTMMKRQMGIYQNIVYLLQTLAVTMTGLVGGTFSNMIDFTEWGLWALPPFTLNLPGLFFPIWGFYCFAPETKIEGFEIKEIQLGQRLSSSCVISTMKFSVPENSKIFDYNGVRVSAHHIVLEGDKCLKVRDSKKAKPIIYNDKYLYNLCTTNHILYADNGSIFADYDEHSSFIEYEKFNSRILRMLNIRDNLVSSSSINLLDEHKHPVYDRRYKLGVGKGSLVDGIPIEMCQLGDNIDGIITHLREPGDRIFLLGGVYFLEYTKIFCKKMNTWITIRDHPDAKYVENYAHTTFHYITTKNHIVRINDFICADFIEIDNAFEDNIN